MRETWVPGRRDCLYIVPETSPKSWQEVDPPGFLVIPKERKTETGSLRRKEKGELRSL